MTEGWIPRLHVEITEEQYEGLKRLQHGTKRALFSAIIDDLNKMIDEHGELAIAAIACYSYRMSNRIMDTLSE